jgi:hypothetical protein
MAPNPNLRKLHDAGVSIWLDTLSRQLLQSGDFAALIRDCSVTGATSNPTIFAKAITGSDLYDDELRSLASEGMSDPQELFSRSHSTTSAKPPGSSARPSTRAAGATGSSRSSAPPTSPRTPTPRSPKRPTCGSGSISRT